MDNEIQLIGDGDGLAVIGIRRMSNASSSRRGCSRNQSAAALLGAAGPGKVTMPSSVRGPLVDGPALCAPGSLWVAACSYLHRPPESGGPAMPH